MTLQVDFERVRLAHKAVRAELLAERSAAGHWIGEVASSPLATAAAISALVVAHDKDESAVLAAPAPTQNGVTTNDAASFEDILQSHLSEVIVEGLHWLARYQNADGGWGDATGSRSNLHAALLVQAAFRLTGVPAKYADLMDRADEYVSAQGGIASLRYTYGKDRLLAAPILANCALAGMVPWRQVPTLPFEWACLPAKWAGRLRLLLDRLEVPLVVAIGQAKFHHDRPRNPLTRTVRSGVRAGSLSVLERLQARDGSFFDAVPVTAFVVMSLASAGRRQHSVVQHGVEFLLATMRPDASWPVVPSLAVTNTVAAWNGLTGGSADRSAELRAGQSSAPSSISGNGLMLRRDGPSPNANGWHAASGAANPCLDTVVHDDTVTNLPVLRALDYHNQLPADVPEQNGPAEPNFLEPSHLDWLLSCQSSSGGWGWSDAPGAPPNTDDTAAVLVALARMQTHATGAQRNRIERAARLALDWLLDNQNVDGGWPAFRRGPSALGLDTSAPDLTAHALQALAAWQGYFADRKFAAIARGQAYIDAAQREDGSFTALRFGNEHHDDRENPVCGTSRVLAACAALDVLNAELATRAARWLVTAQHSCGGWGPPRLPRDYSGTYKNDVHSWRENDVLARHASVEETSLAISALLPLVDTNPAVATAVANGLNWLVTAIEQDEPYRPTGIGNYFGRLWYHDRLLPLATAAGALCGALQHFSAQRDAVTTVGSSH